MAKIKIFGIGATQAFLTGKAKEADKLVNTGLNNAALHIQNEVKESIAGRKSEPTSVDTGQFMRTVDFNVGKASAVIFSPMEYAKYLEYGTRRISPRSHFRNTKAREKNKVVQIMRKEIKKI